MVDRSGARVLTTELGAWPHLRGGDHDDEASKRALRGDVVALRFPRQPVLGLFNAIRIRQLPLPERDGVVTFLDFGCCEPLSGAHKRRPSHACGRDPEGRRDVPHARTRAPRDEARRYEDFALDYSRRCFEPLFGSPVPPHAEVRGEPRGGGAEMKSLLQRNANVTLFLAAWCS